MNKLNLKTIAIVAVTSGEEEECIKAIEYSSKKIKFSNYYLFTDKIPSISHEFINYIKIKKINDIGEWGKFIVFDLYKYISDKFILLVHPDGFVVNPDSWKNEFLHYDYIGSPWKIPNDKKTHRDINGNLVRVGNSVSIRSKKILELPSKLNLKWKNFDLGYPYEDGFICVQNRHILKAEGIKYAPFSLACFFGREAPLIENIKLNPFVFHKWEGPNIKFPSFNLIKKIKFLLKLFLKKLLIKYRT